MNRIQSILSSLRASLWFVPALVVLASVLAAVVLVAADEWMGLELVERWPRLFGASAEGSRAMLSSIATSMITVAGVIFSITIVALSMTSTQYSPRVLRNFMRDRPTQVVLGVFVGIFAYCLVVLRTIRGADSGDFIPSIAVLAGMGYAFGGIAMLIYFIHHVAQSIQASSIVARITNDTTAAIDHLFPDEVGRPAGAEPTAKHQIPLAWKSVRAGRSGYVTAVDSPGLLEYAARKDRVLRLVPAMGEFVAEGASLIELGGLAPVDKSELQALRERVSISHHRTVEQDAAFGVQQLVDVAVKALSPGINDPTTASLCIDHLGALLARLGSRHMPDPYRMADGRLRVIVPAPEFAGMLALAFEAVLQHSRGDIQVLGRVLDALTTIGAATHDAGRRVHLAKMTRKVHRELQAVEPPLRSVLLRRRSRMLERSLLREARRAGDAE